MSKHETKYSEGERELQNHHLSNFGINPYAVGLLVGSYIKRVSPHPVSLDYIVLIDDKEVLIELELRKPGYVGPTKGDAHKLDTLALRMLCRSYFDYVSPWPVSFVYQGIEVHIRAPGVSDSDRKNIARNIFDPT